MNDIAQPIQHNAQPVQHNDQTIKKYLDKIADICNSNYDIKDNEEFYKKLFENVESLKDIFKKYLTEAKLKENFREEVKMFIDNANSKIIDLKSITDQIKTDATLSKEYSEIVLKNLTLRIEKNEKQTATNTKEIEKTNKNVADIEKKTYSNTK
jgi:hypothetical protein